MPATYAAGPWFARCDGCGHEQQVQMPEGAHFGVFERVLRGLGWRASPYNRTTTRQQVPVPGENEPDGDLCPRCNLEGRS